MTETQIINFLILIILIFPVIKLIFVVLGKPLNAFVWSTTVKWEKEVELPRLFLTILFIASIFVIRHEYITTFERTTSLYKWVHWIEIISIFSIGALLNLVYSSRFDQILKKRDEDRAYFFLKNPEKDKRVFNNICKYFIDNHQLFEYSLSELEDLINPNNKGLVFNISDSQNKKLYFYLFLKVCKEVCFIKTNTEYVAKNRFQFDNSPLLNVNINDNQHNNYKKLSNKEKRELKENLKSYQVNWEIK